VSKISKSVALILLLALWAGVLSALTASLQTNAQLGASSPARAADPPSIYLPYVSMQTPRNTPFGLESHSSFLTPSNLNYTKDLKVGTVRMGVRIKWHLLQPVEGGPIQWDLLKNVDQELRLLNAADIDAVVVFSDSPLWAVIKSTDDMGQCDFNGDGILEPCSIDENGDGYGDGKSYCGAVAVDKFDDFAAFVQQVVMRYSTPEYNVRIWELGNEPDVDPSYVPGDAVYGCWGDEVIDNYNGAHYGKMLKVVTPAIKAIDPGAQVWVGGLLLSSPLATAVSNRFLTGILAEGAAPYFDAVPYHWYAWYYQDTDVTRDLDLDFDKDWKALGGGSYGKAVFLNNILKSYGVTNKMLVLNEIALGCSNRVDSDLCTPLTDGFLQSQANFIPRAALRAMKAGVRQLDWFVLEENTWGYVGLLDITRTPKPVYYAYRNLIVQYDEGTFLGETLEYGTAVEAYAVQRKDGKRLHVVWNKTYSYSTISVPLARLIAIVGRDGEVVAKPAPVDGSYKISVGFSPVYLILTP
jgi:hypothetical protein